ncbi:unnamed protein product [Tetraodon nigroviridis]|uniref:(spotted green pufferfish) hypothetical protein n=1 Tax=Tetraodon nigroviridis TaxID=99883 RepID=Q4S7A8_TETNG|nr:unnamed protein product [Tetraodon nigroviridis]
MDYFLLLCSLLLPVVSAVEGKKSPLQLLFAMPSAFSPPSSPRHVSPSPGRSWVPQRKLIMILCRESENRGGAEVKVFGGLGGRRRP